MDNKPKAIVYMCSYCGKIEQRASNAGRPMPGNCPRKPRLQDGKMRPHTWVISKKF